MPFCRVNQTLESVVVEVPTASLPPVVQVGMSPGAFGAFWAEVGDARNPRMMKSAASAIDGRKWLTFSLALLGRAQQASAPTGKILTAAQDGKMVRYSFQEVRRVWGGQGRSAPPGVIGLKREAHG